MKNSNAVIRVISRWLKIERVLIAHEDGNFYQMSIPQGLLMVKREQKRLSIIRFLCVCLIETAQQAAEKEGSLKPSTP